MMIQIGETYNLDLISNFLDQNGNLLIPRHHKGGQVTGETFTFQTEHPTIKDKLLCGSFGGGVTAGDPNPFPIFAD